MTTERIISFSVPGEVRGQGRPRATIRGSHASVYESSADKAYKYSIQQYATQAMNDQGFASLASPTKEGITVDVACFIRTPKSMPKKNLEPAYRGEIRPIRKPDLDNVLKAVLDAMNSVVYRDDSEVTSAVIGRYYSDRDRISVKVRWKEEEQAMLVRCEYCDEILDERELVRITYSLKDGKGLRTADVCPYCLSSIVEKGAISDISEEEEAEIRREWAEDDEWHRRRDEESLRKPC